MNDKVTFSLSYEQLLNYAEEEIRKCNVRESNPWWDREVVKAETILHMWHTLAIHGHQPLSIIERVNDDLRHQKALHSGADQNGRGQV